ncbi:MAG: hypothetical protein M1820_005470 [Bogoriella megaspora]|nr:MAG: hypothetical protein M1820_005470 [Bogoriella megaspora]
MTTIISAASGWALQGLQFGVNEIASSIVISKQVGSVFSRSDDAKILDVIEARYGVHVRKLPEWLDKVDFSRNARLFGQKMRHVEVEKIMEDVYLSQLQGIATFITLCTRYVLPTADIQSTICECLQGMGGFLTSSDLEDASLPYNIKPLILRFVEACRDADSDSKQSRDARSWMAELAHVAAHPWRSKRVPTRDKRAVDSMLCDLFNRDQAIEDAVRRINRFQHPTGSFDPIGSRVHNTLHINVAYVAVAAAANGADVAVQVMRADSAEIFPRNCDIGQNTFVVRLWLTKPPENVIGVLRYSNGDTVAEPETDSATEGTSDQESAKGYAVFGGSREIALYTAERLGYDARYVTGAKENAVMALWSAGQDLADNLRWVVKGQGAQLRSRQTTPSGEPLRLGLDISEIETQSLMPQAVPLAGALERAIPELKEGRPVMRAVAAAVHRVHLLDTYVVEENICRDDFLAAMRLVLISIAVGLLQKTTHSTDGTCNSYVMSVDSLDGSRDGALKGGALQSLVPAALSFFGIGHHQVLWAASTLWGGATQQSQGHAVINKTAVGVVAPHCTVIMDVIRDPELFAMYSMQVPLLMVCRGSVPMLPRSRHTGFVQTGVNEDENRRLAQTGLVIRGPRKRVGLPMTNELIVTFEPVISDSSYGTFCFWYGGALIHELNPLTIMRNLAEDFAMRIGDVGMVRPIKEFSKDEANAIIARLQGDVERSIGDEPVDNHSQRGNDDPSTLAAIWLAQEDLLEGVRLNTGESVVFFDAHGIPSWLVCAAGVVDQPLPLVWRGNVRDLLALMKDKPLPKTTWVLIRDPL